MKDNYKAAIEWLSESDILNKDKAIASYGGVNNGYLWKERKYQYVYNEITGYSINAFLGISNFLKDERYLENSKDAADYLIKQQSTDPDSFDFGGISHSLMLPDLNVINNYYSFDNAVILHGMANLYKYSNDEKYKNACIRIADFLLRLQKGNGSFYSYYDSNNNITEHPYDEFFYDNGCLHVKNAIGLMCMKEVLDKQNYFDAAVRLCRWGELLMGRDGLFWANPNKKYVFTHAHCYATEGYLWAYHLSQDDEYLAIALRAGNALINLQNSDGSLFRIYKNKISMRRWLGNKYRMSFNLWRSERKKPWKTVDATAQSARIWSLLYCVTSDKKYLDAAKKAVNFILKNQVKNNEDPNMFGGFYYQICDNNCKSDNILSSGMYTWCTQFSLSAMIMVKLAEERKTFKTIIDYLF